MSAAEVVARDEAGELRARLQDGQWRALLEHGAEDLLAMMLLDDLSWWLCARTAPGQGAAGECLEVMRDGTLARAQVPVPVRHAWCDAPPGSPEELRTAVAYTRGCIEASTRPMADHYRALAIIERFAPP